MFEPVAFAQSSGTGTVAGRVLNATNGRYLKNAIVAIEGSAMSTITDEFGDYRLSEVPAGAVTLSFSYGGLDPKTATAMVTAGQVVRVDVALARGREVTEDETVELDPFTVTSERDTNASAIATNEQRYADSIKTVVSVDAFGGVHEGNAAEFLKYLPGIAVDYVGSNANTILVRGFGSAYTSVSVDGARVATAGTGSATRATEFWVLNTNNVSRVEVTKEPTPDKPADSLGGSVNMVPRTAFEYAKPTFQWQLEFSMNDQAMDPFKKTPGPYNQDSYKVLPGGSFNYINPLTDNFGFAVNALVSNQFNVQRRRYAYWLKGSGTYPEGASVTNPYMSLWTLSDSPADVHRRTYSVKTDWKLGDGHVFGLTLQTNKYFLQYDNRNLQFTPQSITSFGPTFTQGGLSSSSPANMSNAVRQFYNDADQVTLTYRHDGKEWKVTATVSGSVASAEFRDTANGHFNSTAATMNTGSQLAVLLDDIRESVPGSVTITDADGNSVDFRDLTNYRMTTVQSDPVVAKATMWDSSLNVERMFRLGNNPASVKAGIAYRANTRDNRRTRYRYTFLGADGVSGTADDVASPYLDTNYLGQDNAWGWNDVHFISSYKLYDTFIAHPEWFQRQTVSDAINNITNSEYLEEKVTASYLMGDIHLLQNRLQVLGGVRWEKTADSGRGPLYDPDAVYVLNSDGSFAHDDDGNRIRKDEAGASGSIEEVRLTRKERGYIGESSYDGLYPSLHINYNVTDNTIVRLAYARTFGRPDLSNIVPTATIVTYDEDSTSTASDYLGTISATNVALKPWTANCYDLSIEHYFGRGGVLSGGVFRKDISNFFSTLQTGLTAELAAEYGIPESYVGYLLTTKINGGAAQVDGLEFNYQQKLDFGFLPDWARDFSFTANTTQLDLKSDSNTADFSTFIKSTTNVGLTYAAHRWVVMVKLNHRGKQLWTGWRNSAFAGDGTRLYYAPRKYIDLNIEYQLRKGMSLFCNVRNATDVPQLWNIAAPETPDYARDYWIDTFGRQISFGLKGSF